MHLISKEYSSLEEPENQSGFTLIEVAIALIVISLLMVPIMQKYQADRADSIIQTNKGNLLTVKTALQKFVYKTGAYPIPAPMNGVFDANGGASYTGPTPPCSINQTTVCVATVPWAGGNKVLIGAVPYAAIGLSKDLALDAYKNKILYAVSMNLTNPATYSDSGGHIRILNYFGSAPPGVSDNAHYVLLSFGRDGKGAFTAAGQLSVPCPAVATEKEDTNCNNDASFTDNSNGALGGNEIDDVIGPDHFDDFVNYTTTNNGGLLWMRNTPGLDIYNSGVRVRVGSNIDPVATLDISGSSTDPGNLKADKMITKRVCAYGEVAGCTPIGPGSVLAAASGEIYKPNVFAPGVIADTQNAGNANKPGGGILCDGTAGGTAFNAMAGVASANEVCASFSPTFAMGSCPAGQAAHGIKPDGKLDCVIP